MPVGFGFIDVGKNAQASIDIFNNAFEKNVQHVCSPRYLVRNDGGVNEEEFADPNKLIVHVDRNMGQDSIQPINVPTMVNSNYISILENKINEMKETTGNRDATNGGTQSGVTAAAAIAAMQESAGKTSRDQINTTFDAHKEVVTMVIELIRQFYSMPRQFRITGKQGEQEFVQYSNAGLQPQDQGTEFGIDMGYRVPAFDVKVGAEKSSSYSRLAQNELAMQFYNAGFFNPQYADQVSACLEMMDFQGKQSVLQKVQQNGGMYQQMLQMQQQMLQLSEMIDQLSGGQYNMAGQMSGQINQNLNAQEGTPHGTTKAPTSGGDESAITKNAREQAAQTTNPA